MKITISGLKSIDKELNIYIKKITDLSSFYKEKVRPIITNEIMRVFGTKGYGDWAPRKDNKQHPLLILTGDYYFSLLREDHPDNIHMYGKKKMTWGTRRPYAIHLEEGTSRMVSRATLAKIIEKRKMQVEQRIIKSLERYLGLSGAN